MSNAGLNQWQKVIFGKDLFDKAIAEHESLPSLNQEQMVNLADDLISKVMQNDVKQPDHLVQKTHLPFIAEKNFSSLFVKANVLNDWCVASTVLVIDCENKCFMTELRYSYEEGFKAWLEKLVHTYDFTCCEAVRKPNFKVESMRRIQFKLN